MKAGELIAGRYRLESRLGMGGMGEVWKAVHTGTGRDFAIKFMHAHAAASENARQRFSREARASAKINHPNIIDVFDVGEMDDGVLYLVMELLDGVSLGDAFHAQPPLSIQDLVAILLDTAQALSAAHAVGIIHRDIKPANIFLHRDRATGLAFAKVLDFGISKFTGDDVATKTGSILGSPRYMSPEQTRSASAADPRADIWAMGVMMFEGLTGTWPHEGDSFSALVVNICTVPPLSIDSMVPNLPERVRSIVRDCLSPYAERIQSAADLGARLEGVIEDDSLAQLPLPRPLHTPGEGFKSTTGLRVRPPAVSSLSSSRNQMRTSAAQQNMTPLPNEPGHPPPAQQVRQSAGQPPARKLPPPPASVPRRPPDPPTLGDDTTTQGHIAQSGPGFGGVEPATLAFEPSTIAFEPSTVAQEGPRAGGGLGAMPPPLSPRAPPSMGRPVPTTAVMPQQQMQQPGMRPPNGAMPMPPSSHPSQHGAPPAQQTPLSVLGPSRMTSNGPQGDPLVQSVSAMHMEAPAPSRPSMPMAELRSVPSGGAAASTLPQGGATAVASNKKLGIAAAVLAAAFVTIVVALVATLRGGSTTVATPDGSGAPLTATAPAAAPAQPGATVDEPKPEPASSAAAAPPASSPSSVASSKPKSAEDAGEGAAKASKSKGDSKEPKKARAETPAKPQPPPTPPPTPGKPPKRVSDLGSGL